MLPTRYRAFTLQTAVSQEREENRPATKSFKMRHAALSQDRGRLIEDVGRIMTMRARRTVVLEEYRKHVAERAAMGIVAKPLDATQNGRAGRTVENPPAGEEEFLLDLLINRVPPGVDEAAYVKAGFLAAIAKGEATLPWLPLKSR